jgi:NTE family protein
LPVAVARDAEVVVALGFKGVLPRRIDRPSRLFGQVSTAMINNLQAAQVRAAVAAGQRIVQVELDIDRRVGLWQSSAIPRIFDAGKQAAERHLDQIFSLLAGGGARAA